MITTITIEPKGDAPIWPDLPRGDPTNVHGAVERIAVIEAGMLSGKAAVMLGGRLDDGAWFAVETSAAHILALAAMIRGRFGDEP